MTEQGFEVFDYGAQAAAKFEDLGFSTWHHEDNGTFQVGTKDRETGKDGPRASGETLSAAWMTAWEAFDNDRAVWGR
jgi:hypothetical protein